MINRIPDYLKLHVDHQPKPTAHVLPEFERLCALFPALMGFRVSVDEQKQTSQLVFPWSDSQVISYRVSLEATKNRSSNLALEQTREMEDALEVLLNSLSHTRHELRRREAELATFVPVVSVNEDGAHLADRLEAILRSTADLLDCFGAGLYLLDEHTTMLRLRAHHGLDDSAFVRPPRPLEDAAADVEALAGHAVVIEDTRVTQRWNVPEESESAICVPISTGTSIMGTLWMYRDEARDFTPREQNLAEILAGRVAADLERSVLIQEVRTHRGLLSESRVSAPSPSPTPSLTPIPILTSTPTPPPAHDWAESRIAPPAPVTPGWDIAASSSDLMGDFSHWHMVAEDQLRFGVGASHNVMRPELSAVAFQAAHAAHTQHAPRVKQLFSHLNETLWTSSIEGDACSLFHAALDPTCGVLDYGVVGAVYAYVLRPHGWEPLVSRGNLLGSDCDVDVEVRRQVLMPGDVLFAVSCPERSSQCESGTNQIAEQLLRNTHLSAAEMSDLARELLTDRSPNESLRQTTLIAKRDETLPH